MLTISSNITTHFGYTREYAQYKTILNNNKKTVLRDATVTVTTKDGKSHKAKIVGIDNHGYLKVEGASGATESVQPDGNSFDIMKGLIYPKNF